MGRNMLVVKEELLKDEEFRAEFVALEDEFALALQLIEARKKAHLTLDELFSQCDESAEDNAWLDSKPVGRELL